MNIVIGLDIGGTTTTFGLVNEKGDILKEATIPTKAEEHVTKFLPRLYKEIHELLDAHKDAHLKGIGIGAPNANFYKGTIEKPANLKWGDETPLVDIMEQEFKVKTALTNDAKAAAIGEMKFGVTKDIKNFIMITLGTGLGSGIVVNGDLVYGHTSFAGELGHLIVKEEGRMSPFDRRGSLEAYVSVTGLRRTVSKMLADLTYPSELRSVPYDKLTGEMISEAALKGDKVALEAFEYTGMFLGKALSNAVLFTSPEAIVLFGGLAYAKDLIFQPTLRYMEKYMLPVFRGTVRLMLSGLQDKNAAVLGSAALIWHELGKK
jgi:glucokinase